MNEEQYYGYAVLLITAVILFCCLLNFVERRCCKKTTTLETANISPANQRPNNQVLMPASSVTNVTNDNEDLQTDFLDLPPSYANSISSSARSSRHNLLQTNSDSHIRILKCDNGDDNYELPPSYEQAVISLVVRAPEVTRNHNDGR